MPSWKGSDTVNRKDAMEIVNKELDNGMTIEFIKETDGAFAYLCEADNPDIIPNKVAAAVNKTTGRIGWSVLSAEEAIKNCIR